jgi:large subunit ribosomal protein L4
MKIPVITTNGKKQGTQDLPGAIFDGPVNSTLLAQYTRVFLDRSRQNTKAVKTRGEVAGSTAKSSVKPLLPLSS